jgi:ATP-dependent Clp protease ATP-binding subunit ClpA
MNHAVTLPPRAPEPTAVAPKARLPKWLADIDRLLPIRSQFVLSGNIRDRFLTPVGDEYALTAIVPALWSLLESRGFSMLLVFDQIDGFRVHPNTPQALELAEKRFDIRLTNGHMPCNFATCRERIEQVAQCRDARVAVMIDFASRIPLAPEETTARERSQFFVANEKLALTAHAIVPTEEKRAKPDAASGPALFNPVVWLLNRAQDLPSWYTLDSERVHLCEIGKPDYEQRLIAARMLSRRFVGAQDATDEQRSAAIATFADSTDDLSLQAMSDISQLAIHQRIALKDIDDAIRSFKVGELDNPWKKAGLRDKIRTAAARIEERVKGQHQAVTKTVDILMRSVTGLTGAQARSSGSRPRGVLFFAGPTGVGKTELAKTLTQILFGDDGAYIRFDMSEFAEEHAGARLLGAPPGYVGYEAGGELTNAMRRKPFSVVLFDEIEKAHPRLLDKFLQVLEDGRLTDGRGETVYFSESILVFTSNLGIYVTDAAGNRVQSVSHNDDYPTVESRVRTAISNHFKFQLGRPEILNRIGDNIVVFNFIRSDIAGKILDGMLANVAKRVMDEHKLKLVLAPHARTQLQELCTADLSNGGRGIGNRLETVFINPLARALFLQAPEGAGMATVRSVTVEDNVYSVELVIG